MRKLLKAALAAGVAAASLAVPASATHSWGGYHWARTANPFTIKLGNNLTSQWSSYLVTTSSDWSQSSVLDTVIVAGGTKPRNCRATNGMVEVCNSAYGNTGWLGIASISIASGNHITSGTTKMNDTYYNTAQYNTPAWRNLVMCQEVGHTFGLGHQDENFSNPNLNTCMDYTNLPESNQHPNQHDYDMLVSIYNHADTSTTIGQSTSKFGANSTTYGPGETGLSPKSWGRPVAFLKDGRPHTYARVDGAGTVTITEVFWVPGMGPKDSHVD